MRISTDSSLNLPPTTTQVRSITRAYRILHFNYSEKDIPPTRWEARNLIYDLWGQVRAKGKKK